MYYLGNLRRGSAILSNVRIRDFTTEKEDAKSFPFPTTAGEKIKSELNHFLISPSTVKFYAIGTCSFLETLSNIYLGLDENNVIFYFQNKPLLSDTNIGVGYKLYNALDLTKIKDGVVVPNPEISEAPYDIACNFDSLLNIPEIGVDNIDIAQELSLLLCAISELPDLWKKIGFGVKPEEPKKTEEKDIYETLISVMTKCYLEQLNAIGWSATIDLYSLKEARDATNKEKSKPTRTCRRIHKKPC